MSREENFHCLGRLENKQTDELKIGKKNRGDHHCSDRIIENSSTLEIVLCTGGRDGVVCGQRRSLSMPLDRAEFHT